jgi:glycosyltransferase involved in cell wall biosynthesis
VSHVRDAARALRHKFRLMAAFGTVWPAAVRGGKLLATGQFREFGRKLFNEMDDVRAAAAGAPRSGPQLFLAGHVLGLGGYDHVVRAVLRGLLDSGVDVCRDPRALFRKELVPAHLRPTEARREWDSFRLAVAPPHRLGHFRPDARTAALTMWETDELPADGVEQLNRCGLVVVPSRWGAACFRKNGVKVPIEVVPLGIDPTAFRASGRREPAGCAEDTGGRTPPARPVTTFGTAGALDEGGVRKNVQRVVKLFQIAFPTDPDVRLRVKITPASPAVETHEDGRIDVIRTPLPVAELADWYRSLTAYVNASFGEGFGLHLLEAMASGRPLISTRFGGVGEFFDANVGYEVGYRLVEAKNAVYRGRWADPCDRHLIDHMWRVRKDHAGAARLGDEAARRAAGFRWEDTVRKLVIVLIRHGFVRHDPAG